MSALPIEPPPDVPEVVPLRDDEATDALLEEIEPGPLAMMLLLGLRGIELDVEARVVVAAAWERQAAWVAAQGARALAAVNADANTCPASERIASWG